MGLDIFAKIDGIPGESLDAAHKDEIEVLSFSWGVTHPVSWNVALPRHPPTIEDLTFVHKIDKASALLLQACVDGRHVGKASITYRNAQQQDYLVVELRDVSITGVTGDTAGAISGQAGSETVSLAFARIELEYMPQKADVSLDTGIHFNYDLMANRVGAVPLAPLGGRIMPVPPR